MEEQIKSFFFFNGTSIYAQKNEKNQAIFFTKEENVFTLKVDIKELFNDKKIFYDEINRNKIE